VETTPKSEPSPEPETREELIKVFSSPTNRAILSLLAVEPTYPRKIGNILSLSEAEAARRLKAMEGMGLVEGQWSYVGKNIKLYRLAADQVTLKLTPQGITVELGRVQGGASRTFTLLPFPLSIPLADDFIGREKELATLDGPERVVVVEGMAGIGKTSLVARYAHTRRAERTVFWHSFRGLESLGWFANRFAVFMAQQGDRALLQTVEQGTDPADARELLLRAMDDPRFLLVFDDVHRIEDPAVRTLLSDALDRMQKTKLIVTGRESPRFNAANPGRKVLHLAGLRDDEVNAFLTRKNVQIEPALLPKVRDEVGGHPLALTLLLQSIADMKVPLRELLDRIPERNIEDYLLNEVVGTLSDDERMALSLASVFRASFAPADVNALSKKDFDHALVKLRRRLLVHTVGTNYILPEMIRNYFYNLQKDRAELHAKAAQHYLTKDTIEGRLEAMHHYLVAGKKDRILQLLEDNLDLKQFDFIDAGYQNLYYTVLSLFKPADVLDAKRWALIQDEKGDICLHKGDATSALQFYEDAKKHLTKAKDSSRDLDLAWKTALAQEKLERIAEARKLVQDALKTAPAGGIERQRLEELASRLGNGTAKKQKAIAR
jgi:tetratricopeptide (TPR) repeat protein/DNA-binding transcriptional ArsR family regulator